MEYYNNILCVTFDELCSSANGPAVVKRDTLYSWIRRKKVYRVREAFGEGVYALFSFDSLPEDTQQKFIEKHGHPAEKLKKEVIDREALIDNKARAFYEAYTYIKRGLETHLSDNLIEEYTLNASILNELIRIKNDREALTKALNNSRRNLWKTIVTSSEKLRESYGHTLPRSLSRLRSRICEYQKQGYECLISGKIGNRNTIKITEAGGKQLIALKRSRIPVYTNMQIFQEYNRIALLKGWKPLESEQSVRDYLYSAEIKPLWYDAVHGEIKANQFYSRKHRTRLPSLRDSLWYGDGTKLNIYYLDEEGMVRTTGVYEVVDAYSEVLLGYYISDSEDYEAQYHAYRMAIQKSGHKPYELVYDNQGGHKKLNDFFGKISTIHRPTRPYSGQSKTIENVFSRFQQQVLHKHWAFTGQNITAVGKESRANLELVYANRDKLFSLNELKAYYQQAREEWNRMPHPATGIPRIEMYESSVNPNTEVVGVYEMIDIFWIMNNKQNTFTSSGLELIVKGKKYTYDVYEAAGVPDQQWRLRNIGQRFYVQYDPYNFTSIRLYRKDKAGNKRFERIAEPYMTIARGIQEQTPEEKAFIKQEERASQEIRIKRIAAARIIEEQHGQHPAITGLRRPKVAGVSKAVDREIEKRVWKYRQDPKNLQSGKNTKIISNMTIDELDGEIKLNPRRVASKY